MCPPSTNPAAPAPRPYGNSSATAGTNSSPTTKVIFHPHLHILAANGLFTPDGHFHCMPAEDLDPAIELFRHRFLHALREAKLISPKKLADLLSWKHSGFHIHDGGEKPVPAHDSAGRKRCGWSIPLQTVQGCLTPCLPIQIHGLFLKTEN